MPLFLGVDLISSRLCPCEVADFACSFETVLISLVPAVNAGLIEVEVHSSWVPNAEVKC